MIKERNKKILVFILIMFIGITILSRIAYTMSSIEVKTENIKQMKIKKSLGGEGKVIQEAGEIVKKVENQMVISVKVNPGQNIVVGTELFAVDMEILNDLIKEKQDEIGKLELSINKECTVRDQEVQAKDNAYLRAEEAYMWAKESAELSVSSSYKEYERCAEEYNQFINSPDNFPEKTIEEFEKALKDAEYNYNTCVLEKEKLLSEASRAIDDANAIIVDETTINSKNIEKNALANQLQKLDSLKNEGGIIKSSIDGIVTDVFIKNGEIMSNGAAIVIADTTLPNQVELILDYESAKEIQLGTPVILKGESKKGETKTIADLVVNKIAKDEEENYHLIIETGTNDWNWGEKVQVEITNKTNVYSMCIPLSALHMEQDSYFIYSIQDQETILGTENISKRIDVEVIDMGDQHVAIKSEEITEKTKIIIDSKKTVQNNSRVKVVK